MTDRFTYTTPDGSSLTAEAVTMRNDSDTAEQAVAIRTTKGHTVYVPATRVEEVVAGIRDAARQATGQQPATDRAVWGVTAEEALAGAAALGAAIRAAQPSGAVLAAAVQPSAAAEPAAPANHNTETEALRELHAFMTTAFQGYEIPPIVQQEVARLTDAYRAAILNNAADEIAGVDFHPNAKAQCLDLAQGFARRLRRLAAGAES